MIEFEKKLNIDEDCIKKLWQLKASINALKKFGEVSISDYFDDLLSKKVSKDQLNGDLGTVIKGIFLF